MIKQLISGGQNGADLGALQAAKSIGISTGGTAPKGWRVCAWDGSDASNPDLANYGLVEHSSREYPPRTVKNVQDADATVWFGYDKSPGGRLTIGTCKKLDKPYLINPTARQLRAFCEYWNVKVLNVAGNRLSADNPNIDQVVREAIVQAFGKEGDR